MAAPVASVASRAQLGLQAPLVPVEVHLDSGLPCFSIVGLPETAVKESKERVRAALANSGFEFPAGRITVNLSPADLPKEGGRFDLPIALGILLASRQLSAPAGIEYYGELALGGELRPVRGLLTAAVHAAREGHRLVVPAANASEVSIAASGSVHGARHLLEVCGHLRGAASLPPWPEPTHGASPTSDVTLEDVLGQAQAKRALVVAAAGGHSLLLVGPPGCGKSMLAQRLPALLPPMNRGESIEVASIASLAGAAFDPRRLGCRPFRAPHHTTTAHALVGGGIRARPGEVTLAHRGVLFLDELPEFDRRVLEALREPLEAGSITIARSAWHVEFPADFQLVAAMNPCPCGHLGHSDGQCRCTPARIAQYRNRVSGPLLDRIDLRVPVLPIVDAELAGSTGATAGEHGRAQVAVLRARAIQIERAGRTNAALDAGQVTELCRPTSAAQALLWRSRARLNLSARSYHRTLRVARTLADLEGSAEIELPHVAEALQLRRALEPVEG